MPDYVLTSGEDELSFSDPRSLEELVRELGIDRSLILHVRYDRPDGGSEVKRTVIYRDAVRMIREA